MKLILTKNNKIFVQYEGEVDYIDTITGEKRAYSELNSKKEGTEIYEFLSPGDLVLTLAFKDNKFGLQAIPEIEGHLEKWLKQKPRIVELWIKTDENTYKKVWQVL